MLSLHSENMILFSFIPQIMVIQKICDLFGIVFYKTNGVHLLDAKRLFTWLHCFVLLFYFQLQTITILKIYLREDPALWEPYWVLYLL